jgi:hypothetical protein
VAFGVASIALLTAGGGFVSKIGFTKDLGREVGATTEKSQLTEKKKEE